MRFDDLDKKMRVYETAHDFCVSPNIFMWHVRSRFYTFDEGCLSIWSPFWSAFRDLMVATTTHLMTCGFRVIYGYTQSDEISLLLHRDTEVFNRKLRKYDSILAGEASAKFSVLLGNVAAFDCRISSYPHRN